MKYLITESQLDKAIFHYLDSQDFILIEKDDSVYFDNSGPDGHALIRYDKKDRECLIHTNFVDEVRTFFSLVRSDCESAIGRWVENTLQMEVITTTRMPAGYDWPLRIPRK